MPTRFRPYQLKQNLLLPGDRREWVQEGHVAHQVSELVHGLEFGASYPPYEEDGQCNWTYEPQMMVKVPIYACATGLFSSPKIARKLEEDLAFRMLAAAKREADEERGRQQGQQRNPRGGIPCKRDFGEVEE